MLCVVCLVCPSCNTIKTSTFVQTCVELEVPFVAWWYRNGKIRYVYYYCAIITLRFWGELFHFSKRFSFQNIYWLWLASGGCMIMLLILRHYVGHS
jgi:hypothetical protein